MHSKPCGSILEHTFVKTKSLDFFSKEALRGTPLKPGIKIRTPEGDMVSNGNFLKSERLTIIGFTKIGDTLLSFKPYG